MKIIDELKKKFCRHKTIMISSRKKEGNLTEPGKNTRKIKIGMVRTYCKYCDRTFRMTPMGVFYDPVKGIDNKFEEKTVEAPENVRREILKGKI